MSEHPVVVEAGVSRLLPEDRVDASRPGIDVYRPDDPLDALEDLEEPTAFVCSNRYWDDAYLEELEPGSWVTTVGVGYERFPIDAFVERGIAFTNNPGISAEQIAEHVFGMAFAFDRRLLEYRDNQRAREWGYWPGMTDFTGDTCCIVGLGGIGEAVATRAKAFGMDVRGVKRTVEEYEGAADAVYPPERLRSGLADARLVVLAVPLTDDTRGMIGREEIAAVDDDAVLINVSRGAVLDADALLEALSADELRAAGLDVTDPEPLPPDSPLWDRRDVLITPHCAGVSEKYPDRFLDRFLEQYDRWRGGDALEDRVA